MSVDTGAIVMEVGMGWELVVVPVSLSAALAFRLRTGRGGAFRWSRTTTTETHFFSRKREITLDYRPLAEGADVDRDSTGPPGHDRAPGG
jgi:hypothetical protein